MTIKGSLQATRTNDYGYAAIKVSGTWYGADKKGSVNVSEGDLVEFEAFKNAKNYDTYKSTSLKKIASKPAGAPVNKGPGASRDEYWSAKEARDVAVEPRINYFAALDRAIAFVDLALRNGAVKAYEKAKDTGKMEVLTALVYETTQKMIVEAYAQKIPSTKSVTKAVEESSDDESAPDESETEGEDVSWS